MALKIRLRQQGRNNRPFYRVVLTNVRAPRDGKYLEALGWYNPFETEQERMLNIHAERVKYWVEKGAELSECVNALLRKGAPAVVKQVTVRNVARRAKALQKRKERKIAAKNNAV